MEARFNGGLGALLCDNCGKIIAKGNAIKDKFGIDISDKLGSTDTVCFCCEDCRKKYFEKNLEN